MALQGTCESCAGAESGVVCSALGASLETLPVSRGFWRASNRTTDVVECALGIEGDGKQCVGGSDAGSGSVRTGNGGDGYCRPGHSGPLCAVCTDEDDYFDPVANECTACPSDYGRQTAIVLGCISALVIVYGLGAWVYNRPLVRLRRLHRWMHRVSAHLRVINLQPKIKIVVGFYQVVRAIPTVYDVNLPDEYTDALAFMKPLDFDLALISIPGASLGSPADGLVTFATIPLLLCLVWISFCSLSELTRARHRLHAALETTSGGCSHSVRMVVLGVHAREMASDTSFLRLYICPWPAWRLPERQ